MAIRTGYHKKNVGFYKEVDSAVPYSPLEKEGGTLVALASARSRSGGIGHESLPDLRNAKPQLGAPEPVSPSWGSAFR
jgi:hypothetical protein